MLIRNSSGRTLVLFRTYIAFQNKIILKIAPILDVPFVFHLHTCIRQTLVEYFPLVMSITQFICLQCCLFYHLDPSLDCGRENVWAKTWKAVVVKVVAMNNNFYESLNHDCKRKVSLHISFITFLNCFGEKIFSIQNIITKHCSWISRRSG